MVEIFTLCALMLFALKSILVIKEGWPKMIGTPLYNGPLNLDHDLR
jgi:hypothetical protein